MAEATITATTRTEFGQGPNRRLRATGKVPGVLYRKGESSLAFAADGHALWMLLGQGTGRRQVVEISIDGGPATPALFVEWQLDPVRGEIRHVDFKPVDVAEIEATNQRLEEEAAERALEREAEIEAAAASRSAAMEMDAADEADAAEAAEAAEGEGAADAPADSSGDNE